MNERMRLLEANDVGWRALARDAEERAFSARIDWTDRRDDDNTVTFRGYASVFNAPYDVAGLFTETVLPGAFARTLRNEPKIHFLAMHGGIPLASTQGGTLKLREDDRGLAVLASLDLDSPYARSVASAVARGDLDEMSFGFVVKQDEWSDDYSERSIHEVRLLEVSTVPRGANPATEGGIEPGDAGEAAAEQPRWRLTKADHLMLKTAKV
jgi:HK97 family phage prohead protease